MEKKHVVFFLLLILIIVGSSIVLKVVADLNKENEIKQEIKEISKVFTVANIDDDEVNEILERRLIKKGPYAEIENSIKLYYQTLYSDLKNLTFLLDDDNFTMYLSGKNIKDDGPNFLRSRSNLSNSKIQITEYYEKFTKSLSNEDLKRSYLVSGTKTYYTDFYLSLTNLAIEENFEDTLKKEYDKVLKNIDIYNNIFDFLTANKGSWKADDNGIKFDDVILIDEYNLIAEGLNKIESEKQEETE